MSSMNFQYILHYFSFKNTLYNRDPNTETNITYVIDDLVTNEVTNWLVKLTSPINGYNYVDEYKDLTICEPTYYYNTSTKKCEGDGSTKCSQSSDNSGSCIKCKSTEKFLDQDNKCYQICPLGFGDTYLDMCRPCDITCKQCSGSKETECISCNSPRYFLAVNSTCSLNCEWSSLGFDETERKCAPCKYFF